MSVKLNATSCCCVPWEASHSCPETEKLMRLGHSAMDHESRYALQTLKDNVSLFTPEVLDRVNQIVVRYGHEVIGKKVDEK